MLWAVISIDPSRTQDSLILLEQRHPGVRHSIGTNNVCSQGRHYQSMSALVLNLIQLYFPTILRISYDLSVIS